MYHNDFSKEDAIIYHEYAHAVTNAMAELEYYSESGAMDEAFSDYFACSFKWSECRRMDFIKKQAPFYRTLVSNAHYPEDIKNEVHDDSVIYSGCYGI